VCGRFTLAKSVSEVEQCLFEDFGVDEHVHIPLPRYNIAPRQNLLALIYDGEKIKTTILTWGFIPSFGKSHEHKLELINARMESLENKWFLKEAVKQRRCLIVADGFFEWEITDQGKLPYRIHVNNEKIFYFAGIFSQYSLNQGGYYTTAIITKESCEMMQNLHQRMPIMLDKENAKKYLEEGMLNIETFLGDDELFMYPVSKKVNKIDVDNIDCIKKEEPIRLDI